MDDEERVKLDQMLKDNDVENMTGKIRELRHSSQILENVKSMIEIKKKYARLAKSNPKQFESIVIKRCNFLFTKYTNIYNRLYKDQLNLEILMKLINVLKNIEEGDVDQHEGSVVVGKILKEMYIDSALKQEAQRNQSDKSKPVKPKGPTHKITWQQFIAMESSN
jgi:hypothetical protein